MNPNLGTHFTQQCHQHPHLDLQGAFDPTTEEGIVKGLGDLVLWAPFTHVGYSVITQAVVLINHLKDCNKRIGEDPYLKLRKFGEEMLNLLGVPDHTLPKQIFFYNYPNNEVYLGVPGNLEQKLNPFVVKATLGATAVVTLSLEEAIAATKHNTDIIQSRVFGAPLRSDPVPTREVDWEFTLNIGENPLEWEFRAAFEKELEKLGRPSTGTEYQDFKDKFNLSAVLNDSSRPLMDFHLYCVNHQLYWEWVNRE